MALLLGISCPTFSANGPQLTQYAKLVKVSIRCCVYCLCHLSHSHRVTICPRTSGLLTTKSKSLTAKMSRNCSCSPYFRNLSNVNNSADDGRTPDSWGLFLPKLIYVCAFIYCLGLLFYAIYFCCCKKAAGPDEKKEEDNVQEETIVVRPTLRDFCYKETPV